QLFAPDRGGPSVAKAAHCFDVLLRFPGVAQGVPVLQDGLRDHAGREVLGTPHGVEQFFASDQPLTVVDQIQQAPERLGWERNRLFSPEQDAARGVQPEWTKATDRLTVHALGYLGVREYGVPEVPQLNDRQTGCSVSSNKAVRVRASMPAHISARQTKAWPP